MNATVKAVGKSKLLVVDDQEVNRVILKEMFRERYTILEAADGIEAMKYLREQGDAIAVMLLDFVMPNMDGFETLIAMKKENYLERIPVIVVTVDSSSESVKRGFELGVTDVIVKPFNVDVVTRRVYNIIEQYTYRQSLEDILCQQEERLRRQAEEIQNSSDQMIDMLSSIIEFKNVESVSHNHNIRLLTKLLLSQLQVNTSDYLLDNRMIDIISRASAMHDIGKILIPDYILNKPGKLSVEEFNEMKEHPIHGCEILEKLRHTSEIKNFDYCYDICRHHHERWDGNGYPDGLKGDQISIWAQAVSLADAYDALTSKRVYKAAYTSEKALEMILNGECGVFNPVLLDCLKLIIPELKQDEEGNKSLIGVKFDGEIESDNRLLTLFQQEQRKDSVLAEATGEITLYYNADEDKMVFSEQFEKVFGIDGTFYQASTTLLQCGVFVDAGTNDIQHFIACENKASVQRFHVRMLTINKTIEWFELILRVYRDEKNTSKVTEIFGKLNNVNHLKEQVDSWRNRAIRDSLTKLYNQNAFKMLVEEELGKVEYDHGGLFFLDLDNFKVANDVLGNTYGDAVLQRTASLLQSHLRSEDILARWNGDKFVIWMKGTSDKKVLYNKAQNFCHIIQNTELAGLRVIRLSVSIGIARYPEDGSDYTTLVNCANQALRYMKKKNKGQVILFEDMV